MHTVYPNRFNCVGCVLKCAYIDGKIASDIRCEDKKLVVWPEDNYYFKVAIEELVFKRFPCYLSDGVIIIDFSVDYLSLFLNENWLDVIKKINLTTILVAGKGMTPLANFWQQHSDRVAAVINDYDAIDIRISHIRDVFRGKKVKCKKYPALTEKEMDTLTLMADGYVSHDIAERLCCNTRDVYRFQHGLRKKMCGSKRCHNVMLRYAISMHN